MRQTAWVRILTTLAVLVVGLGSVGCANYGDEEGYELEEVDTLDSALLISSNSTGTVGSWYYTFWKDGGTTSMDLMSDGNFSVNWQAGSSYNYVGGPGWQFGSSSRVIGYNCGQWTGSNVNSYVPIYGWSDNPLVEYYVLQQWGTYDPTTQGKTMVSGAPTTESQSQQGVTYTSNGVQYTAYRTIRINKPSIDGTKTFYQFWSKPAQKRPIGTTHEVRMADHFAAWAASGWTIGNLNTTTASGNAPTYQVLAIEVFGPSSSGSANCTVWDAGGGSSGGTCSDGIQNQTETGVDCGGPCAACGGGGGGGSTSAWLEAECANSTAGAYGTVNTSRSGYSGSGHILSVGDTTATSYNGTSSDRATLNFNVNPGNYSLFFRIHTNASANDDSFFHRIDNGSWTMQNNHTSSGWHWIKATADVYLSGSHSIEIANRENGMAMDKIAILPAGSATPSGAGSAGTNCGGGGASCGDGTCNGTETCSSCSADCGACAPSCGDGTCNGTETCSSCSADCGACAPSCGDGTCNGTETCSSCSADCGACAPSCGDGTCNGTETCSSCSADCGACASCTDGIQNQGETGVDCGGPCAACGGGGSEPCTPSATITGGQSGNFNTTGPYCFRTPDNIAGWGCSNFTGRTLQVNDVAKTCGASLPAKHNGYYYFESSAGSVNYSSIYWW